MKRLFAVLLVVVVALGMGAAAADTEAVAPEGLGMTLAEFIEKYNANADELPRLDETELYEIEGVQGNQFLPATDENDIIMMFGINKGETELRMVGLITLRSSSPDFETLLFAADEIMQVIFPELGQFDRYELLAGTIVIGKKNGYFDTSGEAYFNTSSNGCMFQYFVQDDNMRQIRMFKYAE